MNEKRKQIIEAAIQLFAKKGYHATTMQEIADRSGVSKGSVYNHFDSKENLLLMIFKHYYKMMQEKISRVSEDESLSTKERLIKQIHLQFREFIRHQDFIEMQMAEQAIQVSDEISDFLIQIRSEPLEWYKQKIVEVYGPIVDRYAYDLATILNAMFGEYIGYLIIDKMEIDLERLSHYIVGRLDDLVRGLLDQQPEPMMTSGIPSKKAGGYKEELDRLRKSVENQEDSGELLESLQILEKELSSEKPKKVLIQGMLAFLKETGNKEIRKQVEAIGDKLPL